MQYALTRSPSPKRVDAQDSPLRYHSRPPWALPLMPYLCLVIIALFISTSSNLFAATYYFSTSGNDSNPGTETKPKQTLSHAASLMSAGTTIRFKRGDTWYNGNNTWTVENRWGTAEQAIVVEPYGTGPKPKIAGMFQLSSSPANGVIA